MTKGKGLPKSLTHADFEAIADYCYRLACKAIRRDGGVSSMLIGGTIDEGKVSVRMSVRTPMEDNDDKLMVTIFMQHLVQRDDCDFVVLITEAWMLRGEHGPLPEGSISQHPRREDMVLFNIMSKDSQTVVLNPRRGSFLERGKVDFDFQVRGRMVRDPETRN